MLEVYRREKHAMGRPAGEGSRPPLIHPLRSKSDLRRMIRGWPQFIEGLARFGDAVEWSIGPMRETLFFHPEQIGEVLAAAGANGPLGRTLVEGFQEHAEVIGNNGLVMSEGALWKKQRRILQPGMHRQRISEYTSTMVDFAEDMCDQWAAGAVLNMQREMERLTRRIMTRTLFGADLSNAESDEIKRVMDRQLFLNGVEFLLGNSLPPRVPTPLRAALRASSNRLKMLFRAVITRRLNENNELRLRRDTDLLDMLLEARDDNGMPMPEGQLLDEMHNMFLGGYETSSNSLGFIGALLARRPDLQDRIAIEIEQAVGCCKLTFEHIKGLSLVEAVVKEALRLYPPVFALPGHVVKIPTTLCGYDFQPRQRIIVCPYVTQRDPRWFVDAHEFRPDRWLDGSTQNMPRFAWIPFGGGPRVCYGQNFAMAEMILVLAVVMRRFKFDLPAGSSNDVNTGLSPTFMLKVNNDEVAITARTATGLEANNEISDSLTETFPP
ncbi:cytochrome P450 [Mycobacterium avium]|uniref:cytochrome P450 n=1 Tax=Mycobacterium avium TaxID=1764 RepID=UPI000CE4453C|nr:cytochrome P450 [Mycobacterium avium]